MLFRSDKLPDYYHFDFEEKNPDVSWKTPVKFYFRGYPPSADMKKFIPSLKVKRELQTRMRNIHTICKTKDNVNWDEFLTGISGYLTEYSVSFLRKRIDLDSTAKLKPVNIVQSLQNDYITSGKEEILFIIDAGVMQYVFYRDLSNEFFTSNILCDEYWIRDDKVIFANVS